MVLRVVGSNPTGHPIASLVFPFLCPSVVISISFLITTYLFEVAKTFVLATFFLCWGGERAVLCRVKVRLLQVNSLKV